MLASARPKWDPQDRRIQILDCAQTLFAQKGYEATTISDVIASADISKGGFYHHFDSKEALLEAMAERVATETLSGIDPILRDECLDPFARFDSVLRQLRVRKTQITPELSRAFEAVFQPSNIVLFDRVRRATAKIIAPVLVRLIEEGVEEGVFDVPDPQSCVEIILHLNAAAYDAVAAALAERDSGQTGPAMDRLYRMMQMQGIAVDRLLGLPDGSITWIEPETLKKLLRVSA